MQTAQSKCSDRSLEISRPFQAKSLDRSAEICNATEIARKILYQRIKDSIADIAVKSEREIAQKKLAAYRMTPYWFKKNFEDLSDSSKRYLFDFISAYPEFGTLLRTK